MAPDIESGGMGTDPSREEEKMAVLPEQEEMLKRLREVSSDESLERTFYPSLIKESGNEFYGIGIAMIVLGAVRDHIRDAYNGTKNMASPEALSFLGHLPEYIDALIEDPIIAASAKEEIQHAMPHLVTLYPIGSKHR